MPVTVPGGAATRLPGLPIEFDGERVPLRHDIPEISGDADAVLADLGWFPA